MGLGLGPPPSRISSRWGSAQGGVICLPCYGGGIPSPGPRSLSREGILGEEGPRSRPCPQPPQTHPNLKAMRVRVNRNYVQSPEKPPFIPRGKKKKKKTRQKLIYIFCIWSSVLNINCVIFIHFLSLNSPLIYQFNVSWVFFPPTGFSAPLFDLRRLITQYCSFLSACYYPVNTLLYILLTPHLLFSMGPPGHHI